MKLSMMYLYFILYKGTWYFQIAYATKYNNYITWQCKLLSGSHFPFDRNGNDHVT